MPELPLFTVFIRSLAGIAAGLSFLFFTIGCQSPVTDKNPPPHYTAPVVMDQSPTAEASPPVDRDVASAMTAQAALRPAAQNRPLNVLTLSGGGQYGAYAAGVLVSWTGRGDRPEFDVVTGISGGALIAILAYLGPKYDCLLQQIFTTLRTEDLFKYKPYLVHIFRDRSLASSHPLKELIDREITTEMLNDLRTAHASGRRLYVGTMNQLTRRLVVWDLGAVACSGRPDADDIVRKILLATSSIPGLVPPVELPVEVNGCCVTEYHVDAGAVSQSFVRFAAHHPQPNPAEPNQKWLAGSNLFMISGGKLYVDIIEPGIGFINRTTTTVSATLYALYRADLWRLYTLCQTSGMAFKLTDVPGDLEITASSTTFEPEALRILYAAGCDFIVQNKPWRTVPPGVLPGEEEPPRAGLRFTVP